MGSFSPWAPVRRTVSTPVVPPLSLARPNYDAEMRLSTFLAEHFGQSLHVRIPDLHAKVPFAFHY